jgi:hypothetical protein
MQKEIELSGYADFVRHRDRERVDVHLNELAAKELTDLVDLTRNFELQISVNEPI